METFTVNVSNSNHITWSEKKLCFPQRSLQSRDYESRQEYKFEIQLFSFQKTITGKT